MSYYNNPLVYDSGEKVNPNLSITVAQMAEARARGIAISTSVAESQLLFNGVQTDTLPIEYKRGVTLNQIYEQGLKSKDKIQSIGKAFQKRQADKNAQLA